MDIQNVMTVLKNNKCRITPQRKLFLDVLFKNQETLLTVDEICDLCQQIIPDINTTTVYRNIELLDSLGLIYSMNRDKQTSSYKLICSNHHHHHLICSNCGKMKSIDYCPVNAELLSLVQDQGFILNDHILNLFGLCSDCQKNFSVNKKEDKS